jgi:hypothetical protein
MEIEFSFVLDCVKKFSVNLYEIKSNLIEA